jgi:Outer membrane protein beta-barrel domain
LRAVFSPGKEDCVKLILLALVASAGFCGDALAVGARGGLPLGDAFSSVQNQDFRIFGRNRFVVGPTIELRLPAGVGFNFDILYRRYAVESNAPGDPASKGAAQWEFPLMFRYRFPGIVARPFVAAGPTFNRLTGVTSIRNSTVGLAFGGGLDITIPFFHITPELRYSRLFQDVTVRTATSNLMQNQNRVDVLVGFTF